MMTDSLWMIYGAYGYSGQLIAEKAVEAGLKPVIAGRHAQKTWELARKLGCPARIFDLGDPATVIAGIRDMKLVLNAAGPFSATATPVFNACLVNGAGYVDITGEIDVFESLFARSREAAAGGITAIPGSGFDVVPSDCLAAMLHAALPDATALVLAFDTHGSQASPGTLKTMLEGLPGGSRIRSNGRLVQRPSAADQLELPFAHGLRLVVGIPWGDVSTAWYSTGIPDIRTFMAMPPAAARAMALAGKAGPLLGFAPLQKLGKALIGRTVEGPDHARRQRERVSFFGQARASDGRSVNATLETPSGYSLTADAALLTVRRLLAGGIRSGVLTPSMAFGPDFVLELPGVSVRRPGPPA